MRYFTALAFCLLAGSSHVQACLGVDSWNDLFFETLPTPQPDADLIAIVSVSDKREPRSGATIAAVATVIQILKTTDPRVKEGEKLPMQFENSSCGPDPMIGSKGTIIAKVSTDSKGNLVLHPYTHRYRDKRITPPAMLPDGFDMSPRPIQIGNKIPTGFAVVLVGLAGKTSISSLVLDHSQQRFPMHAGFTERSNTIVAFAVPLGLKQLSLAGIGVRQWSDGKPAYTVMEKVATQKIDIDRPGLYYTSTLDTDHPGKFQKAPLPDQLRQFRSDYASTAGSMETVNFKWPEQ